MSPDLDGWLAEPTVRTSHSRSARATPARLWSEAQSLRVRDASKLAPLIRWRLPSVRTDVTFHELFRSHPFALLDAGDDWSISGLCGRIWTLAPDYPRISNAAEYRTWNEPGTVRVLFAHWVRELDDGRAELVSEARVKPVDRGASLRLRGIWTLVRPFEFLIGGEALAIAARRAEAPG